MPRPHLLLPVLVLLLAMLAGAAIAAHVTQAAFAPLAETVP